MLNMQLHCHVWLTYPNIQVVNLHLQKCNILLEQVTYFPDFFKLLYHNANHFYLLVININFFFYVFQKMLNHPWMQMMLCWRKSVILRGKQLGFLFHLWTQVCHISNITRSHNVSKIHVQQLPKCNGNLQEVWLPWFVHYSYM
jgi:hypothetical protein